VVSSRSASSLAATPSPVYHRGRGRPPKGVEKKCQVDPDQDDQDGADLDDGEYDEEEEDDITRSNASTSTKMTRKSTTATAAPPSLALSGRLGDFLFLKIFIKTSYGNNIMNQLKFN
jgi:hypothetical protein